MIGIKTILVPVDFSEPSKTAVNYGLSLALQFNARLVLTHIVHAASPIIYNFPTQSYAFETAQSKFATETLPTLVPAEFRERVNLQTIVKVGEVRSELLQIVSDEQVDLVVMGTHGKNAFERVLLGSLTERMLRQIPVPILTVSHLDPARELHVAGPVPLNHILYATDLSDNADVALKFSIELARGTGARLSVLHVLQTIDTIYWGAEGGYLGEEMQTLRDDALQCLHSSIPERGQCKGVQVTPIMVDGDPYREILRVADEEKVDLVVMNMHGKGFVERTLLGSTAEKVIRSAHVPVLSIPAPAEYATRLLLATDSAA